MMDSIVSSPIAIMFKNIMKTFPAYKMSDLIDLRYNELLLLNRMTYKSETNDLNRIDIN